ncbi:MAG: hypothetical protein JWQ12_842 [Glaciihabitans sp.]|nr:hypothetical protein [Glaciihabitans sp.]
MTKQTGQRMIRSYLRQFDATAAALPRPRRALLREELATHLRDAISPEMSEIEVARVIADLGSPADIIGEEASGARRRRGSSAGGTDQLKILLIVLAVAAGALALFAILPIVVSYLTASEWYLSALVWALSAISAVACAAFIIAARRRSRH